MELRQRKTVLETVRQLDAFPKIADTYVETTRSGGTISILTFSAMLFLLYTEVSYYMSSFQFRFEPDVEMDAKLPIHVDIIVGMPCAAVGADIMDSTNENVFSFGRLQEENTWWEMTAVQADHFRTAQMTNSFLREHYHSLRDTLFRSGHTSVFAGLPPHHPKPERRPDACRVHGSLVLNKVSGNFHITAGKAIGLPTGQHAHISAFMDGNYNFSHRIVRFQFGDEQGGLVHPLEGDEKLATAEMQMYQYFIEVVPTDVHGLLGTTHTYQYSVKEQARVINHKKGSHGVPGIYFKYDMSALKVVVSEDREPLVKFLVRLCAVCGGIYVTSGIVNSLLGWAVYLVCCRLPPGTAEQPRSAGGGPADQRTGLLTAEEPPAAAAPRVSLVTANGS